MIKKHQASPVRPGSKRPSPLPQHQPEDFFVLRSPLLPFDEYMSWLNGAEGRQDLQDRLLALAQRPEIAEALFIASPSLVEGLERGVDGMPAKKAARLHESLARYILRLMTRSTPFGLFAGSSLGELGDNTSLALGPRSQYRRHTRLDMDYLYRLARDLESDHGVRPHLTYLVNSSLYRAAGRLRYAEGRIDGQRRSYHLVAARDDEFLSAALEAASDGAALEAIAAAIAATDPSGEIELEEALEYAQELVDAQILVSDLGPRVTGLEPIHDLIARLSDIGKTEPIAACLLGVRDELDRLDHLPLGSPADIYRQLGAQLEPLGTEVDLPRLFQVDMVKPAADLRLGRQVTDEVQSAIAFLYRLRGGQDNDIMSGFREDFLRRYELGRSVPLVEVLDEEVGIGFNRTQSIGSEHSPLLQGIPFPSRGGTTWDVTWSGIQNLITRRVFEAASQGSHEVVFTDQDLKNLPEPSLKPLPDAFQAMFSLTASSPEAVDQGDFQVLFKSASGPSGAVLLGRFCHGDEALARCVKEHMQREEAHQPDAVFAEIVHLPEGRIGNILLRPVLRQYEIPFLGQSGAEHDQQITVDDLLVTVAADQVILWSKRLNKQVIPRFTSAHNFSMRGLGMYRFLCSLQYQGLAGGLAWAWGPLDQLPFLPRVVYGRTILSPAQWRVEKEEITSWQQTDSKLERLEEWRQTRQLPARVLLADGDNELFVDFDNPLSVEAFLAIVKSRPSIQLNEFLQDSQGMIAAGPEGRFTHEITLPFVRRVQETAAQASAMPQAGNTKIWTPRATQAHLPGSQWLYAKLYTGTSTADGILEGPIHELASRYGAQLETWFFLRYTDPDFHLRLRFHLPDRRLRDDLLMRLSALAEQLMQQGQIWDLRIDTYKPELERYGGAEALTHCEQIFRADSEAVVAMLPYLRGDVGAEVRWLTALASVDQLTSELFANDIEAQTACLDRMKQGFAQEFAVDAGMRKSLGGRLRDKKREMEIALSGNADPQSPLGAALARLTWRAEKIRQPMARLRELAEAERLTIPLTDLGASLSHMAVNRLLAAEARAHEVVLYDFLLRQMMSRRARQRQSRRQSSEALPQ